MALMLWVHWNFFISLRRIRAYRKFGLRKRRELKKNTFRKKRNIFLSLIKTGIGIRNYLILGASASTSLWRKFKRFNDRLFTKKNNWWQHNARAFSSLLDKSPLARTRSKTRAVFISIMISRLYYAFFLLYILSLRLYKNTIGTLRLRGLL